MESIRNLDGLRGAAAYTIGVSTRTVTRHNLGAGMMVQPSGEDGRLPIRQQVDHGPTLQIDEDRAVALAAPPSPVIDAEHARRSLQFVRGTAP